MIARNTDIGMDIDKDDHLDTNTTTCKALLRGESGDTPPHPCCRHTPHVTH